MKIAKRQTNLPATIEDLTKFILIGREQLVAVRAAIRAINKVGLSKEVYEQKKEEAQDMAGALLDAEVKLGELLSEKENRGGQTQRGMSLPQGITWNQSSQFQKMAEHIDIVEKVKQQAVDDDDLPTRTAVLKEIKELDKN